MFEISLVDSSPWGPDCTGSQASGREPGQDVKGKIRIIFSLDLLAALLRDLLALFAVSSVSSMATGTNLANSIQCPE